MPRLSEGPGDDLDDDEDNEDQGEDCNEGDDDRDRISNPGAESFGNDDVARFWKCSYHEVQDDALENLRNLQGFEDGDNEVGILSEGRCRHTEIDVIRVAALPERFLDVVEDLVVEGIKNAGFHEGGG